MVTGILGTEKGALVGAAEGVDHVAELQLRAAPPAHRPRLNGAPIWAERPGAQHHAHCLVQLIRVKHLVRLAG